MKLATLTPTGKDWRHYNNEAARASIRSHRACMRSAAMDFRQEISPDAITFYTVTPNPSDHDRRINRAADHLASAMFYRNLARDCAENLARRKAAQQEMSA